MIYLMTFSIYFQKSMKSSRRVPWGRKIVGFWVDNVNRLGNFKATHFYATKPFSDVFPFHQTHLLIFLGPFLPHWTSPTGRSFSLLHAISSVAVQDQTGTNPQGSWRLLAVRGKSQDEGGPLRWAYFMAKPLDAFAIRWNASFSIHGVKGPVYWRPFDIVSLPNDLQVRLEHRIKITSKTNQRLVGRVDSHKRIISPHHCRPLQTFITPLIPLNT